MTEKKLRKRVEYWIEVLGPLGLGHYELRGVHVVDEVPGGDNAQASVWTSSHYDSFELWVRTDVVQRRPEVVDKTILHELVHVAMRDYDNTVDESMDRWMPPATRDAFEDDVVRRVREGFVERMARTIYAAHSTSWS